MQNYHSDSQSNEFSCSYLLASPKNVLNLGNNRSSLFVIYVIRTNPSDRLDWFRLANSTRCLNIMRVKIKFTPIASPQSPQKANILSRQDEASPLIGDLKHDDLESYYYYYYYLFSLPSRSVACGEPLRTIITHCLFYFSLSPLSACHFSSILVRFLFYGSNLFVLLMKSTVCFIICG